MVLSSAGVVQQQLNGRSPRQESPAAFFPFEIVPLPLDRSVLKQGALSFAALPLGAFLGFYLGQIPRVQS